MLIPNYFIKQQSQHYQIYALTVSNISYKGHQRRTPLNKTITTYVQSFKVT